MADPSTGPTVLYEVRDRVARITLNRPERRNAMAWTTVGELRTAFAAAKADPEVRVCVLTGAGDKAFCAGADLGTMVTPGSQSGDPGDPRGDSGNLGSGTAGPGGTAGTGGTGGTMASAGDVVAAHEARGELADLFRDLYSLGKPTLARVRGYALAGGFGLALACDFVVAAEDAVFGAPEVDVGLWPHMITVPLIRSMPPKQALELMLTARRVDAAEALRIGFVNRVVPVDQLDRAVDELAGTLAAKPPAAVKLGRDGFYAVWDQDVDASLRLLHPLLTITASTEDAAAGIARFMGKGEKEKGGS